MTAASTAVLHRLEFARLRTLEALALLDTPPEPAFDALVRTAARATGAAAASLNLVAAQAVWSKAAVGAVPRSWPRAGSACADVVAADAPVARAAADGSARLAYVGVPLRVDALPVGTLCVFGAPAAAAEAPWAALLELAPAAESLLAACRRDPVPSPPADREVPLHAALARLPVGVAVSDAEGRLVHVNPAWRAQFAAEEPLPAAWPALVHHLAARGHYPDAAGREAAFVAWRLGLDRAAAGQAEAPLVELRTRDGWALVADRALPDGHVVHLSIALRADAAREADAHARQRRELDADAGRSAVLAALPDPWIVVDARGRCGVASTPRHPALALPLEQLAGRDLVDGLPPAAREAAAAALERARTLGRVQRFEYDLPGDDGSVRRTEARVSPMPGGELLVITRDVGERLQAEQSRRDQLVAEMASRAKSEFMSRMSHEMRTPLNAIIGFAQLLRQQAGARLDHVDHILDAGRHLLELVNDVLDLQRVETGDLAIHFAPVPLAPLVEDCIAMLRPLADARGVRQQFVPPAAPLHALADAQRLRQVLLNVGSNAVKYNRPGGRVTWSVAAADGRCTVAVEDTGAGMTPDQLARLFQPFERLGRDTSAVEGTGLGLVIARRLVDAMGGLLAIDSRPAQGTRTAVELPAAPAPAALPAPAAPAEAPVAAPPAAAPLRLLYVEDNRINALLFEETLRRHGGFDLRVAEDGAEALDLVRDWRPDVLVLDAHLPGASGHEVLQRLRAIDGLAQAPAYMCSADAMPEDVQRAFDAGFRAYWTKPLDIEAVLDELRRVRAALARAR